MVIGTSLGGMFDDEFHYQQNQHDPANYPDNNVDPETTAKAITIRPVSDTQEKPAKPLPDFTEDRPHDWVERAVIGMADAVRAPGDALAGKLPGWAMDPETGEFNTSHQMIEKANTLAGLMVTGPAPVASKLADGTLGSFAGVRSNAFNVPNSQLKTDFYKAQTMHMDGIHPDDIYKDTGFFKGADKNWRYEIDDSKSNLKDSAFERKTIINNPRTGGETNETVSLKSNPTDFFGNGKTVTLDKVLDHPELYKAYPELARIKVKELPEELVKNGTKGMMRGDTLYLAPDLDPKYAKSVMLHEVQHAIQDIEGFARGGNSAEFLPKELEAAEKEFKSTKDQFVKELKVKGIDINRYGGVIESEENGSLKIFPPELQATLAERIKEAKELGIYESFRNIIKSERIIKDAKIEAHTSYKRLMGEVEARNVQKRMDFDKFRRAFETPKSTEDVPRFVQSKAPKSKD